MRVLEISSSDLPGRLFNGYELHKSMISMGHEAHQIVLEKYGTDKTVYSILEDRIAHLQICEWERMNSVSHVMVPYAHRICGMNIYKDADLVHCHILHNHMISLLGYERLMGDNRSIWTIHDPWIFTGNCIHPLDCDKWKYGCEQCERLHVDTFDMDNDNTSFMWNLKYSILKNINPYVVVASNFMKHFLQESPFTQHFTKIRTIPFGIKLDEYRFLNPREAKAKYGISEHDLVIGFRADDLKIKGCEYLYQALMDLDLKLTLLCVGTGTIPSCLKEKYSIVELGWINSSQEMLSFWSAVDIFVMPSLAEGFGVMAIEAMAAGCTVVCFEGTTVAEITDTPHCGVGVQYKSTSDMSRKIWNLINNIDEIRCRGAIGKKIVKDRYDYKYYLKRHMNLYEEVYSSL